MLRLTISNQRGGVGKTSTAICLMRYLSDQGKRVLLIDADPQASISEALGLRYKTNLASFLVHHYALPDCVVAYSERVDVLASSRETATAESWLAGQPGREMVFKNMLQPWEGSYDAVIFDSAPSISMLAHCSMFYTKQVLVPVDMDHLSVTGALATQTSLEQLNALTQVGARIVGILPTRVDRRLNMSQVILATLATIATGLKAPLLPEIRTDSAVSKCLRAHKTLAEFDPDSKAWSDYRDAFAKLLELLCGQETAAA